MKNLRNSAILIVLMMIGITANGQDNCNSKSMIAKIDSVAKAIHIEKGQARILYVTNAFDKTDTEDKAITGVSRFYFDGQFLVIQEKYLNINKLLYFRVRFGIMEFYFQGY